MPAVAYLTQGFCAAEVVPLPKSHAQEVGLFVAEPVRPITTGATRDVDVAVKLAVGAAPVGGGVVVVGGGVVVVGGATDPTVML
jgi:hypothetical protein